MSSATKTDRTTPPTGSPEANATLRIGIVGLGGAAAQIMPTFLAHPDCAVVAASDVRPGARSRFEREFAAPAYDDVVALCQDARVNVVYVATPHQYHREHVEIAVAHGKHVIVEKPMALTAADCEAMHQASVAAGVHLLVGHTHSFDAPVMKMREVIRSGRLGDFAMVNTWSYSNFLMRPRRPEELDTSLGGGVIYNQLPHQVDVVRLLGGGLVSSVRSMAWQLDPTRRTEGSHITFLQFQDGSAASLVFSGYDYFDSDEFHEWVGESGEEKSPQAHGRARSLLAKHASQEEEGRAKAEAAYGSSSGSGSRIPKSPERWHHPHCGVTIVSCQKGDMRPSADGIVIYGMQGREDVAIERGPAFPDKSGVVDEMLRALRTGQTPVRNGQWGAATMEVCEAALESARTRREVSLHRQVAVQD